MGRLYEKSFLFFIFQLPELETVLNLIPSEPYHVVVIGTQECERSIGASIVFSSKQKWEALLISAMGPKYCFKNVQLLILVIVFWAALLLEPYIWLFFCGVTLNNSFLRCTLWKWQLDLAMW